MPRLLNKQLSNSTCPWTDANGAIWLPQSSKMTLMPPLFHLNWFRVLLCTLRGRGDGFQVGKIEKEQADLPMLGRDVCVMQIVHKCLVTMLCLRVVCPSPGSWASRTTFLWCDIFRCFWKEKTPNLLAQQLRWMIPQDLCGEQQRTMFSERQASD